MMKLTRRIAAALLAAAVAACGGGGGSPGTTPAGGGGGVTPATPTVAVSLVDSAGNSTNTISNTSVVNAKALVKDAGGVPLSGVVVTFSGSGTASVSFQPSSGTALTGSDGVATIQVLPAGATSSGAGTLTASAAVGGNAYTGTVNYQIPTGASDPATAKVADFVMLLDKTVLQNSGTATAKLSVLTVDAGNNIVPGATVKVTTNANTVFTPGGTVTDASGVFTGTIGVGSDKSDRTVTITTTVNGIAKQTTLAIAGSGIALSTTPAVVAPNSTAVLTARLTDGASVGIGNATLTLGGNIPALSGRVLTTDSLGNANLSFTSPATAGGYSITATGSGITKTLSLQVGSAAVIPAAVIPAGVTPALSALPNIVSPNAAGSTTNQSLIRFLIIDGTNKPVPNVRVRFSIDSTGLGSFDSTLSTGSDTVYTDASGVATATFTPGSTSSPTDGVIIKACYSANNFADATACPNNVTVRMTVANQGIAISIGNDNLLEFADGVYKKKFVVTVADAAGRPVPNAQVDISVDLAYYAKGADFAAPTPWPLLIQPIELNADIPSASYVPDPTTERVVCRNQDLNRNGFVDAGETVTHFDGFGQPILLPRKSDLLISYVNTGVDRDKTDANGMLQIQVTYSMRFATWLEYHIRASTTVSGSQGTAERAFITSFILGDEENGSFLVPPYGSGACNSGS